MNWLKYRGFYFFLSLLLILPGVYSLGRWGFVKAIDFTGGTFLEYRLSENKNGEEIQAAAAGVADFRYQSVVTGDTPTFSLRGPVITPEKAAEIKKGLEEKLAVSLEEVKFEIVGPTMGKELLTKTLTAVALGLVSILLFIGWRFKDRKYGVCAILAVLHDTLILLGAFSLLGHFAGVEADSLFVTAVLTLLSFSVHDTVVVYDRIRESRKIYSKASLEELANLAITETIVRSLNNSLTIIFMLVSLLLLGGETIRWFIAALLIGTIVGTYSSTFVAVPILVVWDKLSSRR